MIAHTVLLLCAVGVLFGLTVAPTLIAASSLITHLVSRERLTEGLSWMGTSLGIGASLGSSASGQVIDLSGYEGGFVTVAVFGTTAALIALGSWRALRRAVTPDRAPVG